MSSFLIHFSLKCDIYKTEPIVSALTVDINAGNLNNTVTLLEQDIREFVITVKTDCGIELYLDEARQTTEKLIELAKFINKYQE